MGCLTVKHPAAPPSRWTTKGISRHSRTAPYGPGALQGTAARTPCRSSPANTSRRGRAPCGRAAWPRRCDLGGCGIDGLPPVAPLSGTPARHRASRWPRWPRRGRSARCFRAPPRQIARPCGHSCHRRERSSAVRRDSTDRAKAPRVFSAKVPNRPAVLSRSISAAPGRALTAADTHPSDQAPVTSTSARTAARCLGMTWAVGAGRKKVSGDCRLALAPGCSAFAGVHPAGTGCASRLQRCRAARHRRRDGQAVWPGRCWISSVSPRRKGSMPDFGHCLHGAAKRSFPTPFRSEENRRKIRRAEGKRPRRIDGRIAVCLPLFNKSRPACPTPVPRR